LFNFVVSLYCSITEPIISLKCRAKDLEINTAVIVVADIIHAINDDDDDEITVSHIF